MLGALKFNSAKCETTCRLCLGRIKLLKNKRNMQMRQYRKDISELLRTGKQDYARIRVEAVIREQLTLTAYEILELYLELLSVRSSLVANSKEIPRDMIEALSSVLYAASRVPDLPELTTLHKMFMQKYGKEYVAEACSDAQCNRWMVNENLRHCLTIEPPEPALKLETLSEIAQEFGVEWDMDRARRDLLGDGDHMMPLPAAAAAAGGLPPMGSGPIPGSSVMYQQQQQNQMPMPQQQQQQQGGYADVAAAAAAAAAAAQQARSAADAAARFANAVGGPRTPPRGGGGGGNDDGGSNHGGGGGGGAMLGSGVAAGQPLDGWLSGVAGSSGANTPPAAAPAGGPAALGRPLQMQPLPGSASHNDPAAAAAAKPGGYRVPSAEAIQRAYDTAQGPPPKPTAAAGTGSSTPPPAAAAADNAPAAAAGRGAAENVSNGDGVVQDGELGLPGVPHAGDGVSANSSSTLSEYDELQKRFDALKKS